MTRPSWLRRAARDRHRHAIEQASRRWRGGRRGDPARARRKILISTQVLGKLQVELDRMKAEEERVRKLCGDSGMPPVQLLGTVVGTLLAERRATALLVGELVRVQEAVVELSA